MSDVIKLEIENCKKEMQEIIARIDKVEHRCTDLEKVDIEMVKDIRVLIEKVNELVLEIKRVTDSDGEKWRYYIRLIGAAIVGASIRQIIPFLFK